MNEIDVVEARVYKNVDKLYNEWLKHKNEAYKRFLEDVEIGYADRDIIEFVKLVFTKRKIYTTSSCSGRITLIDAVFPWLRDESYILFKKHEPVFQNEIENIVYNHRPRYRFWLISSGPIIHFVALDLDTAIKLLKIVHEAGFKHSGIISLGISGIIVEVVSGTWTSFLLKDRDAIIVHSIADIIRVANEVLIEGKKKLEKLFKLVKEADI